ncbi:MAG TPA: tetratricopeptide repeat protein, partial [Kofleriaceae bacterium]|nr:tetratricopeptide repeat protein [Kofleriaceae bacterium]
GGASIDAAVALYAVVESPRFRDFSESVEFQNAEYYLGVSLARSGAYGAALDHLSRLLVRGPDAPYFAPAHRRMVDIALESRDHRGVLERLVRATGRRAIPIEASGERAYLRARVAYEAGRLPEAERQLDGVTRRSRLYSSAVYLRGLIRTRQGRLGGAAAALCEIAATPDDNKFTFVVDQRYFSIKDLARLGLGRIAHEQGDYDDAYYHYFQIPDDSERLPEALFEAAWSMYQKRELGTARDLVFEMRKSFPDAPLGPEAGLLAGYVELADCKFDQAQRHYDRLVAELAPVVAELERIRRSSARRSALFDRALARWRAEKEGADRAPRATAPADKVLALLRLDPEFVRLHDAVSGLRRAAGDAPHVVGEWRGLASRLRGTKVAAIAGERSPDAEAAAGAAELDQDVARLSDEVERARAELRSGARGGTLSRADAEAEDERLRALAAAVNSLSEKTAKVSESADADLAGKQAGGLGRMVAADLASARQLERASARLADELGRAADRLANRALERLYRDTRRVLDKARLGKIDAVIGQKRRLEIEVQDLAAGRFPAELHGRLWEAGLIGDDEEYWPFEGEFWADEYEGWR